MSGVADEQVEVVELDGTVVRIARRSEVRAKRLRHRSVMVMVRDGSRILASQRAEWKDLCPGGWDLVVGGIIRVGEEPQVAAVRELGEEIGVEVDEERLVGCGSYSVETESPYLAELYQVDLARPFVSRDGEIVQFAWVEVTEVDRWMDGRLMMSSAGDLVVPYLQGWLKPDSA